MNNTITKKKNDFRVNHLSLNSKISKIYDLIQQGNEINDNLSRVKDNDLFAKFMLIGALKMVGVQIDIIKAQPIPKKLSKNAAIIGDR